METTETITDEVQKELTELSLEIDKFLSSKNKTQPMIYAATLLLFAFKTKDKEALYEMLKMLGTSFFDIEIKHRIEASDDSRQTNPE